MDTRSIGVFDSGLGGISVLRDIVELMPCENYIYFGDSAHAPYGTKTREAILERSEQCTNFLLAKDVKGDRHRLQHRHKCCSLDTETAVSFHTDHRY